MPRVISSDMRAAIRAHHQNGLSGQNISDKLSLDRMYASKRWIKKEYSGNNVGEVGSDQARENADEPAPASSTFCKHHFEYEKFCQPSQSLAAAADSSEAERSPHNYQANYQAESGGGECERQTHHLSDKMVARRLEMSPRLLKHLIRNIWRNIISIDKAWCYMSHVNGR